MTSPFLVTSTGQVFIVERNEDHGCNQRVKYYLGAYFDRFWRGSPWWPLQLWWPLEAKFFNVTKYGLRHCDQRVKYYLNIYFNRFRSGSFMWPSTLVTSGGQRFRCGENRPWYCHKHAKIYLWATFEGILDGSSDSLQEARMCRRECAPDLWRS